MVAGNLASCIFVFESRYPASNSVTLALGDALRVPFRAALSFQVHRVRGLPAVEFALTKVLPNVGGFLEVSFSFPCFVIAY